MKRRIHEISTDNNDREVVMAAITQDGSALRYASDKLKNDREVVMAAVKKNGWAFRYASDKLKNDREVVMAAINNTGMALRYASDKLKNDREVVMAAVKECDLALQYASDELRADRDIVMAAVNNDGIALRYASNTLKDDRDVVFAAVLNYGSTLRHASERLRNDREVVLAAVSQDGDALQYASERLSDDKEIALSAVSRLCWALKYASEALRTDITFQKAAIELNPSSIGVLNITKESLGQIYGMLNPSRVIKAYSESDVLVDRHYEDSISELISGLVKLSTSSSIYLNEQGLTNPYLEMTLYFDQKERTETALQNYKDIQANWNENVSGKIGEYLSLKDVVSLMGTPANCYVVTKAGSKRPFNPTGYINFLINISSDASIFSVDPEQRLPRDKSDLELGHRRYLSQALIPKALREFVCKN